MMVFVSLSIVNVFILNLLFAASAAIRTFITQARKTGKRIVQKFAIPRKANEWGGRKRAPAAMLRRITPATLKPIQKERLLNVSQEDNHLSRVRRAIYF